MATFFKTEPIISEEKEKELDIHLVKENLKKSKTLTSDDHDKEIYNLKHENHRNANVTITWEDLSVNDGKKTNNFWIAIDGYCYNLTSWLKYHPGGEIVLRDHAGRDATDAFLAFHRPEPTDKMSAFLVGKMETYSRVKPSKATLAYRRVRKQLEDNKMFEPEPFFYIKISIWLAFLFAAGIYCAVVYHEPVSSAFFICFFWQQIAFVGHDLGHTSVTYDSFQDQMLGMVLNMFLGIQFSWWNHTHNVHHCVVNSVDHDPDIQHVPLLACSVHYLKTIYSHFKSMDLVFNEVVRTLVSHQHFYFIPVLCLGRFNLYIQGVIHLFTQKTRGPLILEAGAQILFFTWYFFLLFYAFDNWTARIVHICITHFGSSLLHIQIVLSHFGSHTFEGMPPENEWMVTQLDGTLDWDCPEWLDWFHGGLQFQIEHHLFPKVARRNLRKVREIIRPLAKDLGITYVMPGGFLETIPFVVNHMKSVAYKARAMGVACDNIIKPATLDGNDKKLS